MTTSHYSEMKIKFGEENVQKREHQTLASLLSNIISSNVSIVIDLLCCIISFTKIKTSDVIIT